MLEHSAVAAFFLDARGHCQLMNAAAEALTGFTLEQLSRHALQDLFCFLEQAEGPESASPIEAALRERRRIRAQALLVRSDGDSSAVCVTLSPVPGGRPASLLVEAYEVHGDSGGAAGLGERGGDLDRQLARRRAELARDQESLRHSQKMDALGQLTGGLAHDFNNLLTIIRSAADMLARSDLEEEKRGRYVQAIADTADRASRLTSQLLAFARRQPLKPEVFDVRERLDDTAEMIRTLVGSRFAVIVDSCADECWVEADFPQFQTALINLSVNARDAMEREGTISLRVERRELPPIRGHAGNSSDFIAVSVSDTGAGIAPGHIDHIFEPFFTTKAVGRGTGLGLSQVYGFAKQSGGDVEAESEVGHGTTFTLYLPATERAAGDPEQVASDARTLAGPNRILVVEDNVQVGESTLDALRELGHDVELAANADLALSLLDERNGGFDIVLTDVIMPGLSGMELAEVIAARHPGVRVVLTSGYSSMLAEQGQDRFELLKKPYSIDELLDVFRGSAPSAS